MTVVHPNHIVGINSITVQTGDSLSVHKADGSLIRTIVSNTGVSTFHAIEVSKGGGDLTVGVSTFFVDNSTGRTGIGTDNPQTIFHISDNVPTIRFTDENSTGVPDCEIGGAGGNIDISADINGEKSDSVIRFNVDGGEKLRIDSDGQIIQTAASGDSILHIKRSNTNTTGVTGAVDFVASDDHSVASIQARGDGDNEGAHLQFYTTSAAAGDMFNAANVERLRITSNGNVAIGTITASNANLTVYGDGTNDNKPATIYQNELSGGGSDNGFYVGINHNETVGYVWNYETQPILFATKNLERLRIRSDGNINIINDINVVGVSTFKGKVGFDTTSAIKLPRGSTSERPTDTSSTTPYMRWNSTNSALEVYNGSEWVEIITDYFPSGSTAFS